MSVPLLTAWLIRAATCWANAMFWLVVNGTVTVLPEAPRTVTLGMPRSPFVYPPLSPFGRGLPDDPEGSAAIGGIRRG